MPVKTIPDGYHAVSPYLVVRSAARLIDFTREVFGAREKERIARPDGTIMHAEVIIGDSVVMIGEPASDAEASPAMLYVYLEDVDAAYQRALAARATELQPPKDQLYGDRTAGVRDPFGNRWWMATHKEDVPVEELERPLKAR